MLVVRPGTLADLDAVMELAALSGRGFTSLPEDEGVLSERMALSERSFASELAPSEAWYTLLLEDTATGSIDGIASVRAAVGVGRPHFSFRVVTLAQYSSAIETRFDHQALVLVNECGGWTEVGSLFIRSDKRGGGAGALLAQSRYMLIGAEPLKFAQTVMAELRGWFEQDGTSPFYEGVSSQFFRLPFEQADRMLTATDGQFVLDLAPRHPIYVQLIEHGAREAIGEVHREGRPALAMLEKEGFERTGLIDIFDGGPTMAAPRDQVRTIRDSQLAKVRLGDPVDALSTLLSTTGIAAFRTVRAPCALTEGHATILPETARLLGVAEGDTIRAKVN